MATRNWNKVSLNYALRQIGWFSYATLADLVRASASKCFWCGEETPEGDREIEHVIPLCRRGPSHPGNTVMSCHACNAAKRRTEPEDFIADRRDYLRRGVIGDVKAIRKNTAALGDEWRTGDRDFGPIAFYFAKDAEVAYVVPEYNKPLIDHWRAAWQPRGSKLIVYKRFRAFTAPVAGDNLAAEIEEFLSSGGRIIFRPTDNG
ncbi:MAG: HNH endonuclease [Sulfurisoma sp.]|nr:HNH endonuclease [Sulfurisoma sp.]